MIKQHLIEAYQTLILALEEADKRGLHGFDFSTRETRNKLLKTFGRIQPSGLELTSIFDLASKELREALVEIAPDNEKTKVEKLLQRLQGYVAPVVFPWLNPFNSASQPSIEVNAGDLADAIDTFSAVAKLYKDLVIWLRLKDGALRLSCDTAGVQVSHSIAANGQDGWSLMLKWDAPLGPSAGKLLQSVATRFGEKTERGKTLTLSRTPLDQECKFTVSWGRGSSSQVCLDAWDDNSEDAKRASIEPPQGSEKIKITPLTMQRLVRLAKNAPYKCDDVGRYFLCGLHFSTQKNSYGFSEIIVTDGHRFSVFSADFDGKNTLSGVTLPWYLFNLIANLDPEKTITVARFPNDAKNDFVWFSDGKVSIMTQTLESVTGMEYPAKFLLDLRDSQEGRLKPVNIDRNHLLDAVSVLKKSAQGFSRAVLSFLPDKGIFIYSDSFAEKATEYTSTVRDIIHEKSVDNAAERLRKFGLKVEIKKQSDGQPALDILPLPGSKARKKITLTSENNGPWLMESRDAVQTSHYIVWGFKPNHYLEIDQRIGASIPADTFRGESGYCILNLSYLAEALKSFEDKNDPTTFEFPKTPQSPAVITIGSIKHFIMPIGDEGAALDFPTEIARDALGLAEGDEIPFIAEPSFGAAKRTAKPKAGKPKPAPAPEDKPKAGKPKPIPAPEDKPKSIAKPAPASKPKPAPAKTASQELEELAEMFDGAERDEMIKTARAMREIEEIVRLAAEIRNLGLGAFANTMDDLAALMG